MRTPRVPAVDWTDAPRRFKWTRPFRRKTKSGFCACAITFQLASTIPIYEKQLWPQAIIFLICILHILAQDAVCQSHTGHMTGLWFLPARPLRLNTNEWMNEYYIYIKRLYLEFLRSPLQYFVTRHLNRERLLIADVKFFLLFPYTQPRDSLLNAETCARSRTSYNRKTNCASTDVTVRFISWVTIKSSGGLFW